MTPRASRFGNSEFLKRVDHCPLCLSGVARECEPAPKNLYSEMLGDLLEMDEDALLRQVRNLACGECGLMYKSHWFREASLKALFKDKVPSHPKGWDVISGRFTPENVESEIETYAQAFATGDIGNQRRYGRSLTSIIDSIPSIEGTEVARTLMQAIERGEIENLRKSLPLLREHMSEPAPYKRFSGFSASALWDHLESAVGPIRHYAEVGCPLWGLLNRAIQEGCEATFLRREEPNYWAGGCQQGGVHCLEQLMRVPGVQQSSWETRPEQPFTVIGAFQYLDHLTEPRHFMAQVFERAQAAALILDSVEGGLAIQHFSGWSRESVAWLVQSLGGKVQDDFAHIRPSGNVLYLVSRGEP